MDSQATIADGKQITLYGWYDNKYGYTKQVLKLTKEVASIDLQSVTKAVEDPM